MSEVSMEEYREHPGLGSSDVSAMLRSPAHYRARQAGQADSDATRQGRLIHEAVLEPALFAGRELRPKFDRRTKVGKAGHAEWEENKALHGLRDIGPEDFELCEAVADAVMNHSKASDLLTLAPQREESVFWEEDGVYCKARFDARGPGMLVDLKTTRDASAHAFGRAVAQYGYHIQAAHYIEGAYAALGADCEYTIIAVEKTEPFAVAVYMLDAFYFDKARALRKVALQRYAGCVKNDVWPGYSEKVQMLAAPEWMRP